MRKLINKGCGELTPKGVCYNIGRKGYIHARTKGKGALFDRYLKLS